MHLLFLQFHALICQVAPPPKFDSISAPSGGRYLPWSHNNVYSETTCNSGFFFFSKVALKNFDLHSIRLLYQTIGDNTNKPGDKCNNL